MTYQLFLDDEREPSFLQGRYVYGNTDIIPENEFVIARNVKEAKEIVKEKGWPSLVAFDHDLGFEVETGYDFAKWLVQTDLDCDWMTEDFMFVVHSMNPVGAKNIYTYLENYLFQKE